MGEHWPNHWTWSCVAPDLFGPEACLRLGHRQWVVPRMYWQEGSRRGEYTVFTSYKAAYRIYIKKLTWQHVSFMIPRTFFCDTCILPVPVPTATDRQLLQLRGEYFTVTCEPRPRMGTNLHRSQLSIVAAHSPDPEQSQGLRRRRLIRRDFLQRHLSYLGVEALLLIRALVPRTGELGEEGSWIAKLPMHH